MERKQKSKKKRTFTAGIIIILVFLGIILLVTFIREQEYRALPAIPPLSEQRQKQGVLASELRGRRGIIIDVTLGKLTVKPTDEYAKEGEILDILLKPLTAYVLITIPKEPRVNASTVNRAPAHFEDLQKGDDVFVISFLNIAASTTFSSLRVEKIITP